jgi:hypothetical protein
MSRRYDDRDRRYDDRDRRYDDRDRRYDERRYDDRDRRYDDRRYDDRRDNRRYDERDRRYDERRYDDRRYEEESRDTRRDYRKYDEKDTKRDDRRYDRRQENMTSEPFKIAFLFLVRDDVNFPDIWENYFRGNEDKFTIYCHPKNPENVITPWLRSNIISHLVPTEWGKITDAYFSLINEALKNPENKKFITVSESCLPLKTFDELYSFLSSYDIRTSFIRFWNIKRYDIEVRLKNQTFFRNINGNEIPFIKHYARFCLSRYHSLKLLNYTEDMEIPDAYIHNEDLDAFNATEVGDEFFLSILNPVKNVDYVMDYEMINDNWERNIIEKRKIAEEIEKIDEDIAKINDERKKIPPSKMAQNIKNIRQMEENKTKLNESKNELNRKYTSITNANPYTYHIVTDNDVREALDRESFFWRKFAIDSNIREYYTIQGIPSKIGGKKITKTRRIKTRRIKTRRIKTKRIKTRRIKTKRHTRRIKTA